MSVQPGRLAGFPANWHYLLASNEEQDRFHAVLGEIIAEEVVHGLDATNELIQVLAAARAQSCKTWLDDVRDRLRLMIRAESRLEQLDEAEVVRAVEKATAAAEKTEAAYTKAAAAHQAATGERQKALAVEREFRDAQAAMQTGDQIVLTAWTTLQRLRLEAA